MSIEPNSPPFMCSYQVSCVTAQGIVVQTTPGQSNEAPTARHGAGFAAP